MTTSSSIARISHIGARPVLLTDFEHWLAAGGLSRNTIGQRLGFADARLREWGTFDRKPYEVAEWLMAYRGWTRRTYLAHLRSIYGWLLDDGLIETSPVARFKSPRTPDPRPNPLTDDQVEHVLEAADGHLRSWVMLGFYAGLRCHEIAKVRGEDITETHLFVQGKGGVDATLPTHPLLWEVAQGYPLEGWWFPSPHRRRQHVSEPQIGSKVRGLFRELGIDQGGVHRCRHTYGTQLGRAGVQPRVIQALMRHASLDTTMRYLDVSDPERAAAIRTLGQREINDA